MHFRNHSEPMAPVYFRNMPGLLLAFVVLSTLAHGLTLLFSTEPSPPLREHRFGATIISTVLMPANDKPAATPLQRKTPEPQTEERVSKNKPLIKPRETLKTETVSNISAPKKTEIKTTHRIEPETASLGQQHAKPINLANKAVTTTNASSNNSTTPLSESLANQLEQQRNYLLGEVQNRLNHYLTYPIRARKRGWQGEVIVAFNINEYGHLKNVRLTKSSGYSVLDRSAMTAFAKLDHIELPDFLGRLQAMELQLPVQYKLRES